MNEIIVVKACLPGQIPKYQTGTNQEKRMQTQRYDLCPSSIQLIFLLGKVVVFKEFFMTVKFSHNHKTNRSVFPNRSRRDPTPNREHGELTKLILQHILHDRVEHMELVLQLLPLVYLGAVGEAAAA